MVSLTQQEYQTVGAHSLAITATNRITPEIREANVTIWVDFEILNSTVYVNPSTLVKPGDEINITAPINEGNTYCVIICLC